MSNELTVALPLKTEDIVLPPDAIVQSADNTPNNNEDPDRPQIEKDENDMYKEYIEIDPLVDPGMLLLVLQFVFCRSHTINCTFLVK